MFSIFPLSSPSAHSEMSCPLYFFFFRGGGSPHCCISVSNRPTQPKTFSQTFVIKKNKNKYNTFLGFVGSMLRCFHGCNKFPLAPMGVLAPMSAHAGHSAQPPINASGNFPAHVSAESISPNFPIFRSK